MKVYLPDSCHSKLSAFAKHGGSSDYMLGRRMYVTFVTFLDAIISPHEYPDLPSENDGWNWDEDTKMKAQGMKASQSSFQTIAVFITMKNVLDEVRGVALKLQKHEQDIFNAFSMESTQPLKTL